MDALDLEKLAFSVFRSECADAFKRALIFTVYRVVSGTHNLTNRKVVAAVQKQMPNAAEADVIDAISALIALKATAIYPARHRTGNNNDYHVNATRSDTWALYCDYVEKAFPFLLKNVA